MGCSFCTVRRSDEHYKLQGTCQVNGKNISISTHDQAVEAFQTAKDPIDVEILRRVAHQTSKSFESARGMDNSTQTNITLQCLKHIETMGQLPSPSTPLCVAVMDSFCSPSQCQMARCDSSFPPDFNDSIQKDTESRRLEYKVILISYTCEHFPQDTLIAHGFTMKINDPFYMEVNLQRRNTQDKLGLMLYYKTDDNKTAIYISEIDPEGTAAKDGRVENGDQIIQINGVSIQSHEEAMTLLTKAESKNVTLLVARPVRQADDRIENRNNLVNNLNNLHMDMLEQRHMINASMLQQSTHEDDGGTTDTATLLSNHHEKDSGVGRTDESSEQDLLGDDQNSLCDTLPENHKRFLYSQDIVESGDMHLSNDSFLSVDNADSGNFLGIPGTACERFRKLLELKCLVNANSLQGFQEHDAIFGKRVSGNCDDQETQMLNNELLNIELECLSIIQAHRLKAEGSGQKAINSCTKHFIEQDNSNTDLNLVKNQVDNEGFTSAYNTGESCWSLNPVLDIDSLESQRMLTGDKGKGSPLQRRNSTTACSKHNLSPIQEISPTKSLPGDPEVTDKGKRKQSKKKHPRKSLLTSLHHSSYKNTYIPAHAQHYQSYMQLIQQKSAVEYAQSQVSLASLLKNPETISTEAKPKMGWKVKIRSDGTRYITKRPIRDQLLKDRALRIREERCSATTDDDAASELKLGRYWNKQERKQHVVQAKEQRHQRELMKQCHMENIGNACKMDNKMEPDIIQLSRKKMMKRRNKRIFDNWMTIQELLTHGTKTTDGTRLCNSFLSVTTV